METYSGEPRSGLFNTEDFYPSQGILQSIIQYLGGNPQERQDIFRTPALFHPKVLGNFRDNYRDRPQYQRFMGPRVINPTLEQSILQQQAPSPTFYMWDNQPYVPLRQAPIKPKPPPRPREPWEAIFEEDVG